MAMIPPRPPQRLQALGAARRYGLAFASGAPHLQDAGGFTTMVNQGQGLYPSGINDQVMGIIGPQLQNAADMINRRSQMASGLISGYTNAYKGMVGGTAGRMPGFYNPEIKIARGVAGYARDALVSAGTTSAAGLKADLTQAGVHGPGDINLTQEGAGAGAAAYGTGIAELDALIARKAAQSAESALEPSFAAGMGAQQQGIVAAQLARQLSDLQGNITSQVPGLIQDLIQRQQDVEYRNAQAAEDTRRFNISQAESTREYNQTRADRLAAQQLAARQRKAGIAGPNAPTVAGRQAYWNAIAQQRTKDTGIVYVGTSSGIRPADVNPKKPGIQTQTTLQGAAAAAQGIKTTAQISQGQQRADTAAAAQAETARHNRQTEQAARQKNAQAVDNENNRHNEADNRLKVAQSQAKSAAERARIAQQRVDEQRRHNKAMEAIARGKKKTSTSTGGPESGNYGPTK